MKYPGYPLKTPPPNALPVHRKGENARAGRFFKRFPIGIAVLILLIGSLSVSAQNTPLKVVATTTIIADVARNVGGDLVEVTSLVPPNADVHAFQLSPEAVVSVAEANVLLVNGAGLEEFLGDLLDNAAVEPVVVSTGIEMLRFGGHGDEDPEAEDEFVGVLGEEGVCEDEPAHDEEGVEHGGCDPHVWTDPRNVMVWAANIAESLAAADPDHAASYAYNADVYVGQLELLEAEVERILSEIPAERRVLVTNHEFLAYFAHAFDFKIVGVVIEGGTTLAEPDPQALAELISIIEDEAVPAIFAEVSANTQLAEVVASEAGVNVVTTLYSDSLSEPGGPAGTYLDYLRYNAQTIAEALRS